MTNTRTSSPDQQNSNNILRGSEGLTEDVRVMMYSKWVSSSVYVCVHTQITSAERNNKTRLNVKPSLSNFNAGAANKGVRAYSNFCSFHINIWCFTGSNENLSRVIKGICSYETSEHFLTGHLSTLQQCRASNREVHRTTEVSCCLLQLMYHLLPGVTPH